MTQEFSEGSPLGRTKDLPLVQSKVYAWNKNEDIADFESTEPQNPVT